MAKWIYERWSLKWDSTKFLQSSDANTLLDRKIDIASMNLVEIDGLPSADFNVGDVGLQSFREADYNKGISVSIRYVHENKDGGLFHSHNPMTKAQLANCRVKNTLIESVTAEDGTYPDDGIHTDGFWYVKIKKAFPTMRILRNGQWVEVDTGYVLKDGVWKPIEEIYKLQDGQWVQA